jgi:hypothetical protein
MGTFHVQIPSRGTAQKLFADLPSGLKDYVRDGFAVLSRLPPQNFDEVRRVTLEAVEAGGSVGEAGLAARIDIKMADVRSLLAATSLFATFLLSRDENIVQLVAAAIEAKLIRTEDSPAVLVFYEAIERDRPALKETVERSRTLTSVLPSLLELEITVDMRLGFGKGRLDFATPIALVHLDTDAQGQEIWLQLTKKQVERVVNELQDALRKMEEAEKWAGPRLESRSKP